MVTNKPNIITLDTYDVVLNDVIMEEVGSSEADVTSSIKQWLDDYTQQYTIKEVRFKHHGL